jgi:lysine biosynthesis protein LysW
MATCPECDAEIEVDDSDLEDLEIGDPWDCDACGSRLRVANLDPMDFETDDEDDDEDEDDDDKDEEADVDDPEDVDDGDDDADDGDGGWEE